MSTDKRLVDLTHTFTDNMPVYPGDPCSRLYETACVNTDNFGDHKIESCMHVGTHMDAPLHMIDGAAYICDFPAEKFQGRGVLIDARGISVIDTPLLNGIDIKERDIILVWTGWDKKFRTDDYFENWPVMSEAFAQALVKKKISLIGMDTAGPDIDESFPAHRIFLPDNILIIENLTGLDQLEGKTDFTVHAYPMKYKADAAPVRVIAELAN
jgi:kynurenine formamidase